MNLKQNHLIRVLLLIAMSCPIISWGDDAVQKSTENSSLQSLRHLKELHLKAMEKTNKSGGDITFDPDGLIVRRFDEAIASAEKIIASGGTYGRNEFIAARKLINEEKKKVSERFLEKAKQQTNEKIEQIIESSNRERAENEKQFDATISKANAKYQSSRANANLTFDLRTNAGKLGMVIWNLPANSDLHDRLTTSVNIELLKEGRVVWTRNRVRLNRRNDNSPIRFPDMFFDKVRIETTHWTGSGSGLAEVEVYAGNKNIALGRPCEVSSIETIPKHLDDRDALTDGIVRPTEIGEGYWIPEENTKATVTIDLLGEADKKVLAAAKERAAKAQDR